MEKLIIFLVIVGFSAIRGFIKNANEKAEKKRLRAERANPDRKQKVQGEIEAFLSDVGGEKPQDREAQLAKERRDRRRRQQEAKRQQQQRNAQEQQRQSEIQQRRKTQQQRRQKEAAAATAQKSDRSGRRVGSGISDHVDSYISQHVSEHLDHDIEEYVEATIVDSVESHLGNRRDEMPAATTTARKVSPTAKAVVALMKDPVGVRNAILVNEILSRPRILRK